MTTITGAEDPSAEDPQPLDQSPWRTPFATMSSSEPFSSAMLLLITNDDPFVVADLDAKQTQLLGADAVDEAALRDPTQSPEPAPAPSPPAPSLWCAPHLERVYRELLVARPDIDEQLTLQGIAAGIPKELSGGQSRNLPRRAVIAICDHQYRLLGFHVGVPRLDELIAMIEDAEEVAAAHQLQAKNGTPEELYQQLAQRSAQRLDRMWSGILTDLVATLADEGTPDEVIFDQNRFISLGETLDAAYLADVRRRFELGDSGDQARLLQLEQHLQTRQPWCDSLIALTAGIDFSKSWRDLIEMVWHYPPITADADVDDLLQWANLHLDTDPVVLSLEPPALAKRFPWPPLADALSKRESPWRIAHELAVQYPYRTVTLQELAVFVRTREIGPIDVQRPSMARYVFLEPGRKRPMTVGERDPPARFSNRLKKYRSALKGASSAKLD